MVIFFFFLLTSSLNYLPDFLFFFFFQFGNFLLKHWKANSQQISNLTHSFVHCRIFPQLPVCSYTVVFLGFSSMPLLWNTKKLYVFGCPLIWCTSEIAHSALWFWCIYAVILEEDSKFPSCIWNLDHQHVNFKVLRDSQWYRSLYLTQNIEWWCLFKLVRFVFLKLIY